MIECETCEGYGEIAMGYGNATLLSPPETEYARCPVCDGRGEITEAHLDEFNGVFPDPIDYMRQRGWFDDEYDRS